MEKYVNLVLKKGKKPLSLEKVYENVEGLLRKENSDFSELTQEQKDSIIGILDNGVKECDYIITPSGNYTSIMKTSFRKGRFYGNKNGDARVLVYSSYIDQEGNPIMSQEKYKIAHENIHGAIDGDLVLIDTFSKDKKVSTGVVEKVIERNLSHIMGEVYRIGNSYFVKPIDKKKESLMIALEGEAIEGQRVDVSLDVQTSDNFYSGTVIRAFNHKDDADEDILWQAFECGIDDKFSMESMEQLKSIPSSVTDRERIGRMDLTDWEIYTIDGKDTKDVDDALSYKMLENGNHLVGVHIADVSYYVPKDSALDHDAYKKGTSAYLANRVIPMLPHELSNGICSLNPGVDRLALSCVMEVDPSGKVVNYHIWESVIHSQIKMNYDSVNNILDLGIAEEGYEKYVDSLKRLNNLVVQLRKNRMEKGALEFNRPEIKPMLDENGKVVEFAVRKQGTGEKLIEECMLLANETIAKHLHSIGAPCLNRIHDIPNADRLTEYFSLLEIVGFPYSNNTVSQCCYVPRALQDLTKYIENTGRLSNMLSTNLVRCMSRAKYSPENIGHSGLAKEDYCHFTSPIRRYPDLTIHRLVKDFSLHRDDETANKTLSRWISELPPIAEHTSLMEKAADKAENNTLLMKAAEYMHDHIGENYVGTVIDINEGGLKIQLENYLEGRVRTRALPGEYAFDQETRSLLSLDGKDDYYMGDLLDLKVRDANKETKTIDFKVDKKLEGSHLSSYDSHHSCVKVKARNERNERQYYGV